MGFLMLNHEPWNFEHPRLLCRMDCLCGACICTRAAVCTQIRVNAVNITLHNCFYGAFANTTTTCNTIFTNYVSHFFKFLN